MAVYYSSNKNWKPKDTSAIVVYTDKKGKTTGQTSGTNVIVPENIPTGARFKDGTNVGSYISKELTRLTPTQTTPTQTSQQTKSINLLNNQQSTMTNTYFGSPTSPFSAPGTYVTPTGSVSVAPKEGINYPKSIGGGSSSSNRSILQVDDVMGTNTPSNLYPSGTAMTQQPNLMQNTQVTNWQKTQDFVGAVTFLGGYGAGVSILGGETGAGMLQEYKRRRKDAAGKVLTGNYFGGVADLYNLNQEFRGRTNKIDDTMANINYKVDISPNQINTRLDLMNVGVSPKDFLVNKELIGYDTSGKKVYGDLKPIVTISTDEAGNTLTTTTYRENWGIDLGNTKSILESSMAQKVSQGRKGAAYFEYGMYGASSIGWSYVGGSALTSIGLLGGAATEGGFIGQSITTGAGWFPKTVGRVVDFSMKSSVQLAGVGIVGGLGGYEGYKVGKQTGLNPALTAFMGGVKTTGQYYAFTAGATGGEISPFQVNRVQLTNSLGKQETLSTFSVGEPFSGKYLIAGTKFQGKTYLGFPSKKLFGTGMDTSEYGIVTSTVSNLRGINLKDSYKVDLMNQKTFEQLSPAQKMQWTKEMQGLGAQGNADTFGFRRFTGSITGVYGRQAGDVDAVLGANANADDIASGIASRMGAGFSNKQGQIFFRGNKVFEGLTPENAIPRPMGYFGRVGKPGTVSGIGTSTTDTIVTPAGQSLTELGSAIRFPSKIGNFNVADSVANQQSFGTASGENIIRALSKSGSVTFGVDKTQRIADFAFTAQKLAQTGGKSFDVQTFKNVYSTKYPNINWERGALVSTAGAVGGSSSFSASMPTSLAMAVFAPAGASSTSANVRTFIPPRVSTSTSSSFSMPSLSSSSLSSLSSLSSSSSSFSSRSSPSSLSSSSSSSMSSLSSSFSSSSSSMSSRSSSSSSSSSSSAASWFVTPPFVFNPPAVDFGSIGGKVKSGKRRSKYTPSFGALVFNVRGKQPKGMETGARIRPITKGFKWEFGRMKL